MNYKYDCHNEYGVGSVCLGGVIDKAKRILVFEAVALKIFVFIETPFKAWNVMILYCVLHGLWLRYIVNYP